MKDLQKIDKRTLWHPYTQMQDYAERDLLLIDRAEGSKLFDHNGRAYYDTISSWWCILHGHCHPTIRAAVHAQLDRLEQVLLAGISHEPAILLAEKLVALTPAPLTRVFYSDNGSCACEIAIKMSLQYWQHVGQPDRNQLVAVERGYHGDTIGTMSLGGVPEFHQTFSRLMFDSHRLPSPYCYRCPMDQSPDSCRLDCLKPLERLLAEKGKQIAALIIEPLIQGAGGLIIYPPAYLKKLARLTASAGVHLILDEVASGFARTGTMFAMEQAGVEPDFLCISKGLTGGFMPLAATMTTETVYQAFYAPYEEDLTFYHGHTYTGNPLACASALGCMQVFEDEDPMAALPNKIRHFHQGLERFRKLPWVGDLRRLGMIGALEMVANQETKESFAGRERVGWKIYLAGLEKGLILRPMGNVTYFWLPISVSLAEIDDILERAWEVLSNPTIFQGAAGV